VWRVVCRDSLFICLVNATKFAYAICLVSTGSAKEFQMILEKHPPQVSSREAASLWACAVHNIVNRRLLKEEFDCSTVADKYKCGCAAE